MDNNFLNDLEVKINSIFGDFRVVVDYLEKLKTRERILEEGEAKLLAEQKTVTKVKDDLKATHESLEAEKVELNALREDVAKRTAVVSKREDDLRKSVEDYQREKLSLETEERVLKEQKSILEANISKHNIAVSDLKIREDTLSRQVAIDRERKQLLDAKEEALEKERVRLSKFQ